MKIDKRIMKVLASDTRLEILKELKDRKMMPSFLSNRIGKNKSTVTEHLKILEDAGLVERHIEPGKKWVFYGLTPEGREVVNPYPKQMIFVLVAVMLFIGGILSLFMDLLPVKRAGDMFAMTQKETIGAQGFPIISIVLIAAALGILIYCKYRY